MSRRSTTSSQEAITPSGLWKGFKTDTGPCISLGMAATRLFGLLEMSRWPSTSRSK